MKNTILLFATSFFLFTATFVTAQNNITTQKVTNHSQIDLFSVEVISLFNMMMMDTNNLFNINENLALEMNGANALTIKATFEKVLANEIAPTNNNRSFEFITGTKSSHPLSWNTQNSSLNNSNQQNLVKETCQSVVCRNNTINVIELNNKNWNSANKKKTKMKATSDGNWQFNVGPDENSYYIVPVKL